MPVPRSLNFLGQKKFLKGLYWNVFRSPASWKFAQLFRFQRLTVHLFEFIYKCHACGWALSKLLLRAYALYYALWPSVSSSWPDSSFVVALQFFHRAIAKSISVCAQTGLRWHETCQLWLTAFREWEGKWLSTWCRSKWGRIWGRWLLLLIHSFSGPSKRQGQLEWA